MNGSTGLFYGSLHQGIVEILGAIISGFWAFSISFIIFKLVDKVMNLRVEPQQEIEGLDYSIHGESSYNF